MRQTGFVIGMAIGLMIGGTSRGSAQAYVDPGTGSYVFQLAVAGVFAALYAVRVFWADVRGFFQRRVRH